MLLWLYFAHLILYNLLLILYNLLLILYNLLLILYNLLLSLLFILSFNDLYLFLLYSTLDWHIGSYFILSLVYLKILFIINLAIFEKLYSILMKLLLSNLISHFQYFSIEIGLSTLPHKQFYKF